MLRPGPAGAADVSVQPSVELRAESSSNPGLDPTPDASSDTYGGVTDVWALIGIATPRGATAIRPRIKLQEYADRDVEPVDAFLDLRSLYGSERGQFELQASYDRRDTYLAELPDATFDDVNPDDPTTPQTGKILVGETRQHAEIEPAYSYKVSERTKVGGSLFYEIMRYSSEAPLDRVDYDYAQARGYVSWAVNPRSDIRVGAYGSRYDAKSESNQTDAYGGFVAFVRRWSDTAGTSFEVTYEQDTVKLGPSSPEEKTSGAGGKLESYWTGEISEWRLTAGRTYTPTGRGGKSTSDQLRLQYDRDLSPRLQFRGAARLLSDKSLIQVGSNNDRDYARMELSLKWKISPTWYVRGGYVYTYQDRASDPDTADDNKFFVSFGYLGLKPPTGLRLQRR